mgnify:CR=1 FL=1
MVMLAPVVRVERHGFPCNTIHRLIDGLLPVTKGADHFYFCNGVRRSSAKSGRFHSGAHLLHRRIIGHSNFFPFFAELTTGNGGGLFFLLCSEKIGNGHAEVVSDFCQCSESRIQPLFTGTGSRGNRQDQNYRVQLS